MKQNSCIVCKLVGLLVVIGALNWGLIGLAKINLVAKLLGDGTVVSRVVYGLVGLAGLMTVVMLFKPCPCGAKQA